MQKKTKNNKNKTKQPFIGFLIIRESNQIDHCTTAGVKLAMFLKKDATQLFLRRQRWTSECHDIFFSL